jgi:hypothetical protein
MIKGPFEKTSTYIGLKNGNGETGNQTLGTGYLDVE